MHEAYLIMKVMYEEYSVMLLRLLSALIREY
jgi:hypothetical protein